MATELAIATVAGPWGPVHVAATDRGVVAVEWLEGAVDAPERWRRRFGSDLAIQAGDALDGRPPAGDDRPSSDGRPARDDRPTSDDAGTRDDAAARHLRAARRALEAILAGRPPDLLPPFDLSDRPAWDRAVLAAVSRIGWGETASYGEIARRIGSPRAARAVGGAVGRNPVSLLIPCHRVIAADGTIGGYGGDAWGRRDDRLAIKRALLALEGVEVGESGAGPTG